MPLLRLAFSFPYTDLSLKFDGGMLKGFRGQGKLCKIPLNQGARYLLAPREVQKELESLIVQRESTRNLEVMRTQLEEVCARIRKKLDSVNDQYSELGQRLGSASSWPGSGPNTSQ